MTDDERRLKRRLLSLDIMSESIALSSPSGRMSKRARRAAEARIEQMYVRLHQYDDPPRVPTAEELRAERLRKAAHLRGLARLGSAKQARQLIAEAEGLEREETAK